MSIFEDVYRTVSGFFNWLSSIGGGLGNTLGELGAWLQGGLGWLGESLQSGVEYLATQLYNAFLWLSTKLVEAYETLANWLEAGLEWIGSGLSWIGSKILEGVQWIYNGILWLWDNLVAVFQALVNWIMKFIANAWNTIVGFGNAFVNSLNSFFTNWIKRLREKLISLFTINIALHGMRISYEKLMEQPSLKNLVSMFSAPIISAVAGALLDTITPKPQSETVFVYLPFELPFWDTSSLTLPRVPERPAPTPIEYLKPSKGGYKPIIEIPLKIGSSSEPIIQLPSYKLLYLKLGAEAEGYLPPFIPVELPLKLAETYEMPTGLQELNITNYLLSRNVSGTESQEWYDIYLLLGNRTDKQLPTTSTIDIVNRIYSATSQATPEQELLDILLNLGATNYKDLLTPTTIDIVNTALGTQVRKLHSLYKSDAFLKLKETYSLSSSMLPGYFRPSGLGVRVETELSSVPSITIVGTANKPTAATRAACLSPNGTYVFIGGAETISEVTHYYIYVYNSSDFSLVTKVEVEENQDPIKVTYDGRYLICSNDSKIIVRSFSGEANIGDVVATFELSHRKDSIRLSRFQNKMLVTSGNTIYIFDIPSLSYTTITTDVNLQNADFVYFDNYIVATTKTAEAICWSYPSLTQLARRAYCYYNANRRANVGGNPRRTLAAMYGLISLTNRGLYCLKVPSLEPAWIWDTTGGTYDYPTDPYWDDNGDFVAALSHVYGSNVATMPILRHTGQFITGTTFGFKVSYWDLDNRLGLTDWKDEKILGFYGIYGSTSSGRYGYGIAHIQYV